MPWGNGILEFWNNGFIWNWAMRKNFKITIEYDGTDFHGWQRQKRDKSIQGEIENALLTMTGKKVTLVGSGRTDAGVHAYGQVASFKCETRLDSKAFLNGLTSLLPDAVVIKNCEPVDDTFHARYDVKSKIYRYRLLNRRLPSAIDRRYSWHIARPLELEEMRRAADHIIGTHDFKAFEGSGSPRVNTERTVLKTDFYKDGEDFLVFEIEADGFLRFMVRNIMGTLVAVGLAKISADKLKTILDSKDRSQAGITAPPQGLFLVSVNY